jgi:uncharacterized protein YecT (DUF1311 family)
MSTYQKLVAKIAEKQILARLQEAERAWITYRDKECTFEASGTEGGSVHPMIVSQCRADKARERTKQLIRALDCPEGDLTCVR